MGWPYIRWRLALSAQVGKLKSESALKIEQAVSHIRVPEARDSVFRLPHRLIAMDNKQPEAARRSIFPYADPSATPPEGALS